MGAALASDDGTTEADISGERSGSKGRECGRYRDGPREVVDRDIEDSERGLVEGREGAGEKVGIEAERIEAVERSEAGGNGAGEKVVGEVECAEAVECN